PARARQRELDARYAAHPRRRLDRRPRRHPPLQPEPDGEPLPLQLQPLHAHAARSLHERLRGARLTRRAMAAAAAAALALGVAGLAAWPRAEASRVAPSTPVAERLECRFRPGDAAAFRFESRVALEGDAAEDLFRGQLRWVVVEEATSARPALLRASLSSVVLEQALSQEPARASELEDGPFYLRVSSSCRFTGVGFPPRWSAASRRLVSTLLASYEFVLPEGTEAEWEAEQRDGVGDYTARYRLVRAAEGPLTIVRAKPAYALDAEARQIGRATW